MAEEVDPLDSTKPSALELEPEQENDILQPNVGDYNLKNRLFGTDQVEHAFRTSDNDIKLTQTPVTQAPTPLPKRRSTIQSLTSRAAHAFTTDEKYHVAYLFGTVYVKIFFIFISVVSIYWGSMFDRPSRYVNLTTFVVLDDEAFTVDGKTIEPLIGNAFINMVTSNKTIAALMGWKIIPSSVILQQAANTTQNITERLTELVHHQKLWTAVYINPNSTRLLYESLASGTPASSPGINSLIEVIYEQGRHFSSLTQYVEKHLNEAQELWLSYYTSQQIFEPLLGNLTSSQKSNLLSSNQTLQLLQTPPVFKYIDISPALVSTLLGPSQLGLIYGQIFSFHQFNFSLQIHQYIKEKLKFKHYIIYRLLSSQVNCLVLSLVYALITIAFQVPVNYAYGRGGFMVLWMFMYLFISALGGINENVVMYLISRDLKPYLAPWMVFYIMINISPTFSTFELCPAFYMYGYAMPMVNVFQMLKVVFFNTYKGTLGRNIGVLVGWIVLTNILLFFNIRHLLKIEKRKKKAAEDAKIREKQIAMGIIKKESEGENKEAISSLYLQKIPILLNLLKA